MLMSKRFLYIVFGSAMLFSLIMICLSSCDDRLDDGDDSSYETHVAVKPDTPQEMVFTPDGRV